MKQPVVHGVYTAQFRYLESNERKIRPVIIVSHAYGRHGIVAVVPVSSRPHKESVDFSINGQLAAGLIRPSVARIHRLSALPLIDIVSKLGALSKNDSQRLKKSIKDFLEL